MYIHNSHMILIPTKEAQNLENVKTPETFSDRELTRALRDAIVGEENAIKQYETIADACANQSVEKIMQEISDEERVHVGELQKVLNALLNDEVELLEEGAKEVEEEMGNKEETEETEETEDAEEKEAEASARPQMVKSANMEASSLIDGALKSLAAMKPQIAEEVLRPLETAQTILQNDPNTITSETDEAKELLWATRLIKQINDILVS